MKMTPRTRDWPSRDDVFVKRALSFVSRKTSEDVDSLEEKEMCDKQGEGRQNKRLLHDAMFPSNVMECC